MEDTKTMITLQVKDNETITVTPETIIYGKIIKPFSKSGHVILPRIHEGKRCTIIIHQD